MFLTEQRFTNARWRFRQGDYSDSQLQRAVPRSILAWARREAREADASVLRANLRLPFRATDGTINLNGVRNALARAPQLEGVPKETVVAAERELQRVLVRGNRALKQEGIEVLTEGQKATGQFRISEIGSPFFTKRPKIDKEKGIVTGAKFLGVESSNRRRYQKVMTPDTAQKYDGINMNLDHPDVPGKPRGVRDRFAIGRNTEARTDGIYGDIHYNTKHEYAQTFEWWVENAPEGLGLSPVHVVAGEHDEGGWLDVEAVVHAEHCDIVADAATSKSLFEGAGHADADQEEHEMEWDKITLAELREHRPDLVEEVITEAKGSAGDGDAEPTDEVKSLREEVEQYKAKQVAGERKADAQKLITKAKLPKTAVTELFMEQLLTAEDGKAMKALVEDRQKLFLEHAPVCIEQGDDTVVVLEGADKDPKKFAEYVKDGR